MEKILIGIVFGALVWSCSTPHKLTGTNYVDLANGGQIQVDDSFPTEIARDLGWGDLSSDTLKKIVEEFRFSFTSDFEPYHLFRISKTRGVEGNMILYWRKNNDINLFEPHKNMKQYLKGRCNEFFELEQYEYCLPNFITEPDWGRVFTTLETREIWVRPDQNDLELESLPDSNIWIMNTQVRLGDYFRTYTHTSPEQYAGLKGESNLLGIISQLQTISNIQESLENFNSYAGITSGKQGAKFFLCTESDTWRFNANMEDLVKRSGLPNKIEYSDEDLFYVTVSGTVQSVWYTSRNNNGYEKEITPTEIHSIRLISKNECPK